MKGNQLIGLIDVMASGKTGVLALLAALLVLVSSGVNQALLLRQDDNTDDKYLPLFFTEDDDVVSTVPEWGTGDHVSKKYFFEVSGTLLENFACKNDKVLETKKQGNITNLFCVDP